MADSSLIQVTISLKVKDYILFFESLSNEAVKVFVATSLNKGNSGRTRSIRTGAHIEAVRDELQQNPHGSACRNPVPVPSTSFNRITRLEIERHPYRMHVALEALLLCATMS